MAKTHSFEKVAARIVSDFLEEQVDTSERPNRYEDLAAQLHEFAEDHPDNQGINWMEEALNSKLQGALMRRSKDVGRDEQGNLFYEDYLDRHGITTSEGYIANRYATPEHLQEKMAQLEMKFERAKENKAIHAERIQLADLGFQRGAVNLGEAVAILQGEVDANKSESTSSVLATKGQGFGARQGPV